MVSSASDLVSSPGVEGSTFIYNHKQKYLPPSDYGRGAPGVVGSPQAQPLSSNNSNI